MDIELPDKWMLEEFLEVPSISINDSIVTKLDIIILPLCYSKVTYHQRILMNHNSVMIGEEKIGEEPLSKRLILLRIS